jgi:Ca2+-binding EF-hand superfamily protein
MSNNDKEKDVMSNNISKLKDIYKLDKIAVKNNSDHDLININKQVLNNLEKVIIEEEEKSNNYSISIKNKNINQIIDSNSSNITYEEEEEEASISEEREDIEVNDYFDNNKNYKVNSSKNYKIENNSRRRSNLDSKEFMKYDDITLDNIKQNRLKEIIGYLKVQKQPFDENDLSRIFERLDDDGDQKISIEELKKFLNTLRTPVNYMYVNKIIKEFDENEEGNIDKKDFFEKMNKQTDKINENDLSELLEIYKLFDANHDDKICNQDLLNVMKALGENFSESQCKEMIDLLCIDKSQSSLDFPSFFELVKNEGEK